MPIILILLLSACSTQEQTIRNREIIDVLKINSFIQNDKDLFPLIIDEGYIVNNKTLNRTSAYFKIEQLERERLTREWKKKYKKIDISEIYIYQNIIFETYSDHLTIKDIETTIVIEGSNTEKLNKVLNNQLHTTYINQSSGLFSLLIGIWKKPLIDSIIMPDIPRNTRLYFDNSTKDKIIESRNISITYELEGTHDWIGF